MELVSADYFTQIKGDQVIPHSATIYARLVAAMLVGWSLDVFSLG